MEQWGLAAPRVRVSWEMRMVWQQHPSEGSRGQARPWDGQAGPQRPGPAVGHSGLDKQGSGWAGGAAQVGGWWQRLSWRAAPRGRGFGPGCAGREGRGASLFRLQLHSLPWPPATKASRTDPPRDLAYALQSLNLWELLNADIFAYSSLW